MNAAQMPYSVGPTVPSPLFLFEKDLQGNSSLRVTKTSRGEIEATLRSLFRGTLAKRRVPLAPNALVARLRICSERELVQLLPTLLKYLEVKFDSFGICSLGTKVEGKGGGHTLLKRGGGRHPGICPIALS